MAGSASLAGAANTEGCSAQYELYSVRLVADRMKGGAVSEDRSPLKEEMDYSLQVRRHVRISDVTLVPSKFIIEPC